VSTQHPDDEALFALASEGHAPPEAPGIALAPVRAHVDGCAPCLARVRRLRAGALLLDEVRRAETGSGTWETAPMSPALLAVASQVASDVRSGRLRRPWRPGALSLLGGAALAAAAAWLFHVRVVSPTGEAPAVAQHTPVVRGTASPGVGTPEAPSARAEARVLLASGGVRMCRGAVPGDGCEALDQDRGVPEGARIDAPSAGRAVLSLVRGWTADLRGGATLSMDRLRAPGVDLALAQGEVALTPGEAGALQVRHDRWTVIPEGPVVARVDLGTLRVVVLAGRTEVREGGVSRGYAGPLILDLPPVGAAREVPGPATDPRALDLASLQALPGRPQGGALALAQDDVRGSAPRAPARIVLSAATAPVGVAQPTGAPAAAPTPTGTTAELPAQAPEPVPARDATADEQRFLRASARSVFASCLRACRAQGTCDGAMAVRAIFDAQGQMTSARMVGEAAEGARACLEREARTIRMDPPGAPVRFEIPVED
jgi:hypothetical protein